VAIRLSLRNWTRGAARVARFKDGEPQSLRIISCEPAQLDSAPSASRHRLIEAIHKAGLVQAPALPDVGKLRCCSISITAARYLLPGPSTRLLRPDSYESRDRWLPSPPMLDSVREFVPAVLPARANL